MSCTRKWLVGKLSWSKEPNNILVFSDIKVFSKIKKKCLKSRNISYRRNKMLREISLIRGFI